MPLVSVLHKLAVCFTSATSLDAYLAQYLPRLALGALVPLAVLIFVLPTDPVSGFILLITAPLIPLFMFLVGGAREVNTGSSASQVLGLLPRIDSSW